jgi:hypothetical protein
MATSSYRELSSTPTKTGRIYDWLDERLSLTDALAFARHKSVPQHQYSFWY